MNNRLKALEEYIKEIASEQTQIHHSELKSICEGYRFSYATGCLLAKRYGLKIK